MHFHRLLALIVAPLVVLASASSAQAQRPKRVGVVVTVQVNLSPQEAQDIAAAVGTAIHEEFGVDVISGAETDRRLPEGGLPDECVADATCRGDLGRRLDADELLMLVLLRMGDEVQIDSTWAQVASGDSASRPKVVIGPGDDRVQVLARAAPSLLPHIEKPKVEPATEPRIIVVPQGGESDGDREVPLGSWIAGAASATSLVAGTVLALSARQKFEALESDGCRELACERSRIDSLNRRALTADILFGVSGVAAATALILYFRSPRSAGHAEEAPLVELRPGPGAGLAIGGAF